MTEERARHYAKALARNMGITFYAVRSREGRFLVVQIPSDDCEILATVAPPRSVRDIRQFRGEHPRRASNDKRRRWW
jgi:hypothetical protein